MMSLALCFKLLDTSDPLRSKSLVRVALPASLSAQTFPFTLMCPGQYTHRSFKGFVPVGSVSGSSTLRSSEMQATCDGCFAHQSCALSFPFTLACPGQYAHRSFQRLCR